MVLTITWGDVIGGHADATFVHANGHTILRRVPSDLIETVGSKIKDWRDSLGNLNTVSAAQVAEFLGELGCEPDNSNEPIEAFKYPKQSKSKTEDAQGDDENPNLSEMNVSELRTLADELGIELGSKAKKAELISAIETHWSENK